MKLIPFLFKTPMVQAINDGSKTMTRRTKGLENINLLATEIVRSDQWKKQGDWVARFRFKGEDKYEVTDIIKCPYGKVGDLIWVRETFRKSIDVDTQEETIEYAADNPEPMYRCDGDGFQMYNKKGEEMFVPFKPNIHMPFVACRLFGRITDIRAEHLQDISKQDAIHEGIKLIHKTDVAVYQRYDLKVNLGTTNPVYSFQTLWESIYGERSWHKNPWVWVISFERCEKPNLTTYTKN